MSCPNAGLNFDAGVPKTAAEIAADGTLFGLFTSMGGWTTATGKLPILTGLTGQSANMPVHLLSTGAVVFAGGGTDTNPIQIFTVAQLEALALLVNAAQRLTRAYTTSSRRTSPSPGNGRPSGSM